ncbi:MAG: hypothetical protein HPY50_22160 [Firmicutes bacterium]|nr:hypothetical protein [Bacillota bacterium]
MINNGISTRQNQQNNIAFLAAQRQIYSKAKRLSVYQFIFCVIFPLLIPFLKDKCPANTVQIALVSILPIIILLLNAFLYERVIKVLREKAAKIQELFDTTVLEIKWNSKKCGHKIEALNQVKYYYKKYIKRKKTTYGLMNWYPIAYSNVKIEVGRILCQRSNLSWDNDVRIKFQYFLIIIMCLSAITILLIATIGNKTFITTLVNIVPSIPIIIYLVVKYLENRDTINRLDFLKQRVDELWENLLSSQIDSDTLNSASRQLQDLIYEHRANAFMVWDWFYRLFRNSQEQDADTIANYVISEYYKSQVQ